MTRAKGRKLAKQMIEALGEERIEKRPSLPGYTELKVEDWRKVYQEANAKYNSTSGHTLDRIREIGKKNMVYFVQKEDRAVGTLWFVVDQFRSGMAFPLGYSTRKAAREAIAQAGLIEAPTCKHGFLCEMGNSQHLHG